MQAGVSYSLLVSSLLLFSIVTQRHPKDAEAGKMWGYLIVAVLTILGLFAWFSNLSHNLQ
jgi:drug/metabolite transporter (DMT)-like permease